jgi:hypothetical protein
VCGGVCPRGCARKVWAAARCRGSSLYGALSVAVGRHIISVIWVVLLVSPARGAGLCQRRRGSIAAMIAHVALFCVVPWRPGGCSE